MAAAVSSGLNLSLVNDAHFCRLSIYGPFLNAVLMLKQAGVLRLSMKYGGKNVWYTICEI
jgi:hypothetical protein